MPGQGAVDLNSAYILVLVPLPLPQVCMPCCVGSLGGMWDGIVDGEKDDVMMPPSSRPLVAGGWLVGRFKALAGGRVRTLSVIGRPNQRPSIHSIRATQLVWGGTGITAAWHARLQFNSSSPARRRARIAKARQKTHDDACLASSFFGISRAPTSASPTTAHASSAAPSWGGGRGHLRTWHLARPRRFVSRSTYTPVSAQDRWVGPESMGE